MQVGKTKMTYFGTADMPRQGAVMSDDMKEKTGSTMYCSKTEKGLSECKVSMSNPDEGVYEALPDNYRFRCFSHSGPDQKPGDIYYCVPSGSLNESEGCTKDECGGMDGKLLEYDKCCPEGTVDVECHWVKSTHTKTTQ